MIALSACCRPQATVLYRLSARGLVDHTGQSVKVIHGYERHEVPSFRAVTNVEDTGKDLQGVEGALMRLRPEFEPPHDVPGALSDLVESPTDRGFQIYLN